MFQTTNQILYICIYIYIWVNYNISLNWIKAIWGWFPLLTMIPVRSQWGRYNLPIYIYMHDLSDLFSYPVASRHRTSSRSLRASEQEAQGQLFGGTPSHHGCSNTKPCSWSSMTWMLNGYPKFWTSLYEMRSSLRVRKNTKSWSSMTWMSKGYPYDLGNLQIALTCLDSSRDITDINGYFMKYTSSVV